MISKSSQTTRVIEFGPSFHFYYSPYERKDSDQIYLFQTSEHECNFDPGAKSQSSHNAFGIPISQAYTSCTCIPTSLLTSLRDRFYPLPTGIMSTNINITPPQKDTPMDPVAPFLKSKINMKLYHLNHPNMDSVAIFLDGSLHKMIVPTFVKGNQPNTGFVIGYISDDLGNTNLIKIRDSEFISGMLTYGSKDSKLESAMMPLPDSAISAAQYDAHIKDNIPITKESVHVCVMPKCTVIPRGYNFSATKFEDLPGLAQTFHEMGQLGWLYGLIFQIKSEDGDLPALPADLDKVYLPDTSDYTISTRPDMKIDVVAPMDPDICHTQCCAMVQKKKCYEKSLQRPAPVAQVHTVDTDQASKDIEEERSHYYPDFSQKTVSTKKQEQTKSRKSRRKRSRKGGGGDSSSSSSSSSSDDSSLSSQESRRRRRNKKKRRRRSTKKSKKSRRKSKSRKESSSESSSSSDSDSTASLSAGFGLLWILILAHQLPNNKWGTSSLTECYKRLGKEKLSQQPPLLTRMVDHTKKKFKQSENVRSHMQAPPMNSLYTKYLINGQFKREVDSLEIGLCLENFKKPDYGSHSYISAKKTSNTIENEALVETKQKASRTGAPYSDGLVNTRSDIYCLIANVIGISELFVAFKNSDKGPKPWLLRHLYLYYQLLRADATERWLAEGEAQGYDLIPQIFDQMNRSFCRFIDAITSLDNLQEIEDGKTNFGSDELTEAIEVNNETFTGIRRSINQGNYTFFHKKQRPQALPKEAKDKRNGSSKGPRGSDPKKGLFTPITSGAKPWLDMPPGIKLCQNFCTINRTCMDSNCSYPHKRAHELTLEEINLFDEAWLRKNQVTLAPEVIKRKEALSKKKKSADKSDKSAKKDDAKPDADSSPEKEKSGETKED